MKKWMISLLSVLAFALAFSGCGGSEGGSSGSVTDSTPPVAATPGDNVGVEDDEVYVPSTSLIAAKSSIESDWGDVPANPGATN